MGKKQILAVAESTASLLALLLRVPRFTDASPDEGSNPKEMILSYIFCGNILVRAPSSKTGREAQPEVIRDHKRIIPRGSQILFQENKTYVSRGGQKLEHALDAWNISVDHKICLDCGASTGGFSDCLLAHGARAVYAVDVGYNQLHYSLQVDKRVISLERSNVLSLSKERFVRGQPEMAVLDLSFRSLRGALSVVQSLVREGHCIALCKPQFERKHAEQELSNIFKDFSGVVDKDDLLKILVFVVLALDKEGVFVQRVLPAALTGRRGNQEFFFETKRARKRSIGGKDARTIYQDMCEKAVEQIHS